MVKTVSMEQLEQGKASQAIRDAQEEPVLVSKENLPVAWLVGSERLAEFAQAIGVDREVYDRTLKLVAVELFDKGTLSMGQAAKMAGMNLHDFIDLCGRMHVSVLWEPTDVRAEADALEAFLRESEANAVPQR